MLHGFGSSKDEVGAKYAREAKALADNGVASLRISFRGFGKSDGDTGATTIDQQVGDALAAGHFLAGLPEIDGRRLGVLGFSLGGGDAIIATAKEPELFKSRATWSSVGDFEADIKGGIGQKAFDRAQADGVVGSDLGWRTIVLKSGFFDSLKANSIRDAIPQFKGSYLAVAGSNDFSAKYVDDYVKMAPGAKKEAVIVPGADHIYQVLVHRFQSSNYTSGLVEFMGPSMDDGVSVELVDGGHDAVLELLFGCDGCGQDRAGELGEETLDEIEL